MIFPNLSWPGLTRPTSFSRGGAEDAAQRFTPRPPRLRVNFLLSLVGRVKPGHDGRGEGRS